MEWNRGDKIKRRVWQWVGAWIDLSDNVIKIVSFTYYRPYRGFGWSLRRTKGELRRMRLRHESGTPTTPGTPNKTGKFWYNPGNHGSAWSIVGVTLKKGIPFSAYYNEYIEDLPGKWDLKSTTGHKEKS